MEQITLNMIPKGITPICHASQYDKGRVIRLNLMDGLQGYVLSDETIQLNVRKPDMNIVTTDVDVTSGNTYVDIVTTEQMCACEGDNLCELALSKDDTLIASINFIMRVEVDVLKDGIESETEIHNLTTQIQAINDEIVPPMVAEEVANQYDSQNVIFDDTPTEDHGIGYAVTSEGVKNALDEKPDDLSDLGDVEISSPTSNQALVYDPETGKWVNGEVSTVGSIDDLDDVDTTGKAEGDNLRYDATEHEWKAKPNTVKMTLAEWNAIADKQAWRNAHKETYLVISDAPNLNETAKDISYEGSTDTIWDKVEGVKGDVVDLDTNKPTNTNENPFLKVKTTANITKTVNANSYAAILGSDINLAESGYTPIAIASMYNTQAASCFFATIDCSIVSGGATFAVVKNTSASNLNAVMNFKILFMRTSN